MTARLAELFELHKAQYSEARLNREFQAEAMGLSVRTAGKVLRGETVDRASIVIAFQGVGIPWNEDYCQPADLCDEGEVVEKLQEMTHDNRGGRFPKRAWALTGASILVIVLVAGWLALNRHEEGDIVTKELQAASKAYQVGDYNTAWKFVKRQELQTIKNRRADERAWWLKLEADLLSLQGHYEDALNKYATSFQLFQSIDLDYNANGVLEAMADTELRLGRLDNAQTHYQQRFDWARLKKLTPDMAAACRGLGSIALERGDYVSARKCFDKALAQIPQGQELGMVHDIRARNALALAESGNLRLARAELEACVDFWRAQKHSRWVATTQLQLATVVQKQGETLMANRLLGESKSTYEQLGDNDGVARCQTMLGEPVTTTFKIHTKFRV